MEHVYHYDLCLDGESTYCMCRIHTCIYILSRHVCVRVLVRFLFVIVSLQVRKPSTYVRYVHEYICLRTMIKELTQSGSLLAD